MLGKRAYAGITLFGSLLPCLFAAEPENEEKAPIPPKVTKVVRVTRPPYEILLRARSSDVAPKRNRNSQTGSGYIDVVQRDPGTVMVVMRGAIVAGSETHKPGMASMHFTLEQEFDIVATREGLRPPQLAVVGMLTGILDSTQPQGGCAEQGPACFSLVSCGQRLLSVCIKPHSVASCQNLFVTEREGPYYLPVVPGPYVLHGSFDLNATSPPIETACPSIVPAAGAVFGWEPRLDARWNYVFAPFRAVPHQNFGFGILLRVREKRLPGMEATPLPFPRKLEPEAG